ncbi:MAG: hypothetical protein CVU97_07400 [Firmicutes bacterium HGW-Firmicutes-21]|nr:MAG: hypothetical protein CVU97_07400 [Firmicutes bacterium HGW-Firmicutes-21]
MSEEKRIWYKSPVVTTPLLVIFVLIMLNSSRYILQKQGDSESNIFLVITVIQLVVLILPCILYYLVKGKKLTSPMFISMIRPSHIIFIIFTLLLFISGTVLIKYIYYAGGNHITSLSGYFDSIAAEQDEVSNLGIIISLIVVPAFCEEIFFRGVVLSEYRGLGSVNAVIMSALCFSMLHFSLSNFPIYFFTGIILGFVTVVTRSLIAPILLHLISNTLSIYGSDLFLRVTIQKSGAFFIGFVILMIFGLSLIFVISKLEQIYFSYAEKPPITALPQRSFPNIPKVYLSPSFLALIAVFLIIAVLT